MAQRTYRNALYNRLMASTDWRDGGTSETNNRGESQTTKTRKNYKDIEAITISDNIDSNSRDINTVLVKSK